MSITSYLITTTIRPQHNRQPQFPPKNDIPVTCPAHATHIGIILKTLNADPYSPRLISVYRQLHFFALWWHQEMLTFPIVYTLLRDLHYHRPCSRYP